MDSYIQFFGWGLIAYVSLLEVFFERTAMKKFVKDDNANSKKKLYIHGFIRTWALGVVFLACISLFSIYPHQLFLVFPSIEKGLFSFHPYLQIGIILFLAWWVGYFFIFALGLVRIGNYFRPYIINKLKPVESITPKTAPEYFWWIANAFSSPIEELIYRGFIFFFFTTFYPSVPIWCVIFISIGLEAVHYAPRWVAMKYVATSGLAFTLCFLIFHSIVPAMILHVIYDLRTLGLPFRWVREQSVPSL